MVLSTDDRRRSKPIHRPAKIGTMPDRFVRPRLCECDSLTSLAECTGMVELNPQDPMAYRLRGIAHLKRGNHRRRSRCVSAWQKCCFDKAIADFTTAIRLAPEDVSLYIWRGIAYRAGGQLEEAIADHTKATRLEPKGPRAYDERGAAHEEQGDMAEASEDHEKAEALAVSLW